MKVKNEPLQAVLGALLSARSLLLVGHVSPDGDALGSILALRRRLMMTGRSVQCMVDGNVPAMLSFLPDSNCILTPDAEPSPYDTVVSVDVASPDRMGRCFPFFEQAQCTVVIDHHGTNPTFGDINWIDGTAPAAAVLIWRLINAMDGALDPVEACCLYTGLSTDTGNFLYSNVTPESFEMMADLMRAGLNISVTGRSLFRDKELPFLLLIRETLPTLHLLCDNTIAGTCLTRDAMHRAGVDDTATDGLVDYPSDIVGVKLAYFARETAGGDVKMSLRSRPPYRVDGIAARLGGGGHDCAAGLTLRGMSMDQARELIEKELAEALKA